MDRFGQEEERNMGDGERGPGKKIKYSGKEEADCFENRYLWAFPDGRIFSDASCQQADDFLSAIAEPVSRQELVHEYILTAQSLYKAVSAGMEAETIVSALNNLCKTKPSKELIDFIHASTDHYWKVILVSKMNRYFIESQSPEVLKTLLTDGVIRHARYSSQAGDGSTISKTTGELEPPPGLLLNETDQRETHSFEIRPSLVESVRERCLPNALNFPLRQEYDFRNNNSNSDLDMELKPHAQPSPHQDDFFSNMFRNGRAKSGIMVLPGAVKSLVGVSAAARIKKSCLCLAANDAAADQWALQFKMLSTIRDDQICRFTSDSKELLCGNPGVVVTTYDMVSSGGIRSKESEKIIEELRNTEWGLLLMDEVHVGSARLKLKKVIKITKSHCKLGLTAILGDDGITDLKFLVGPKLYEADWQDFHERGYTADVQCAEVWCPMTKEFLAEYLKKENSKKKQALYVMNPNKFRACESLIRYHEERGDKIMVFADSLFALKEYAKKLQKPVICRDTSDLEQTKILEALKTSKGANTVFLSKIAAKSIDIPEAKVVIQISSHARSEKQEAQLFNRIRGAKGEGEGRMAGGKEEYDAFFYSLVSTSTHEMDYSMRRQKFFSNQGYSYKVITHLSLPDAGSSLCYHSKEEELALLAKVLDGKGGLFCLEQPEELTDRTQGMLKATGRSQRRERKNSQTESRISSCSNRPGAEVVIV